MKRGFWKRASNQMFQVRRVIEGMGMGVRGVSGEVVEAEGIGMGMGCHLPSDSVIEVNS